MDTKLRSVIIPAALYLVLIVTQLPKSTAFVANQGFNPPYSKAISDLKEAIVKGLGFQADDFKISGFDLRDAQVGRSVAYEFDVEIDNKVLPLKLLEDVNRWEYVDLPIFQREHLDKQAKENGLLPKRQFDDQMPVLAPFQLAGPMELWIQDADDMRISLPHDVDAGVLKKVILADGAVVTVKGAKSVSLRHPVELPLPLNRTNNGFASGLLTLAEFLQDAARSEDGPIISLRIVGPTSITSPAPSSPSSNNNRLKLKRLAPGLVGSYHPPRRRGPTRSQPSISKEKQQPFYHRIGSARCGRSCQAKKGGSFRVLKADVSAQTFVKIGFEVEKKVKESEIEGFPEWRTKPSMVTMHFEVLAKVDGNKVVPERVVQVEPVMAEDSIAPSVIAGNVTMSTVPVVHLPPSPFTL
ncbi:hypothetical protein CASFOL_035946 [Castilleja foliolosa]|uniref:Uncharacterized protein n=1 Tax=Castilleja foliolosa TaxID=1961234 RepID=A0ABD3BUZ5_9LAMI